MLDEGPPITLTQHDGSTLILSERPCRVISLVPSITENFLRLGGKLIGRTSFCVEPHAQVKAIPVMGGTKTPKLSRILSAEPDLVLACKEENRREDVQAFEEEGVNVWVTNVRELSDVPQLLSRLADLAGQSDAPELKEFEKKWTSQPTTSRRTRACTLIWKDPYMAVGPKTYADALMRAAGYENLLSESLDRYAELTLDALCALDPDVVFLPDEPFVFQVADQKELEEVFDRRGLDCKVRCVDGQAMFWPGLRTPDAKTYLEALS